MAQGEFHHGAPAFPSRSRSLLLVLALWPTCARAADRTDLPTPLEHYRSYDWEADAKALVLELAASVPEETRASALALFGAADGSESLDAARIRTLLGSIDWKSYRPRVESLLLHGSRALEVVPNEASAWLPLIHDSLLLFLDGLGEERFLDRIVAQATLPRTASRGERVLAFVEGAPSLQKLAQIFARNPSLAPDIRVALQSLENDISSARYDEILAVIRRELPSAVEDEYAIEFRDHLLAEASVGAVVEASYRSPGSERTERAACKVLKPRAVEALAEDLAIVDRVLAYLEEHASFYDIGDTPLVDIFEEIREALSREVQVADERENLIRAREYYRDVPEVLVPAVLPFSTQNVTCMEFVEGVKITDAFPGQPEKRRELAHRLSDALTFDVLFSRKETALFHGDPHAGNVFHVEDGGPDPYRIALLDWGLAAEFSRDDRAKMAQLVLGLYLKDSKRLANNVSVLVDFQPKDDREREEMRRTVAAMIEESTSEGMFPLLDDLMTALAKLGYKVRYEAAIFIKAQLTISGILLELEPGFEQDAHVIDRLEGQIFHEIGPRLLRTVWFPDWNSHDYQSLMSNEDVKDVQVKRTCGFFKTVGKAIWTGVSFQWLF
jgi:ubiquinone biosynthesis protein